MHPHTIRFTRGKLPHWEVKGGRYFATVRCADSLPADVIEQLGEVHRALREIESQSEQFAALQRKYFLTLEKYLDAGAGKCPLRDGAIAVRVAAELESLAEWNVDVPHYSVMPNHWHAMIVPRADCTLSLAEIMRRVKGRSARAINEQLRTSGAFWQREWFDRWMRTDAEYLKCVRYIRENPVKAGIAERVGEHPWTR
jgi:REP element-mobilizing transposase RayT